MKLVNKDRLRMTTMMDFKIALINLLIVEG